MAIVDKLSDCRQWLIHDQYDHGEFGKHEIAIGEIPPRDINQSRKKPNIFSSVFAYYTLIATGEMPITVKEKFQQWLSCIRSDNGYWTSESGSVIPYANSIGQAKTKNLRHTAKALDYYLLCGEFSCEDAVLFNDIIAFQLDDGSYPQFSGMDSDLWCTAYFINLLIRATLPENLKRTRPRGKREEAWKLELDNTLNRAVDWMLSKLSPNSLWCIKGMDVTLGVMAEIAGYLALHRPEACASIIRALLNQGKISASLVYVACLSINTLRPEEQAVVKIKYEEIISGEYRDPIDLIDAVSLCKLAFLNGDFGILLYYRDISNGHESQIIVENKWNSTEYFRWALHSVYDGQYHSSKVPLYEADFWQYINQSICEVKREIEDAKGWKLLWDNNVPVNEEKLQIYIDNSLKIICEREKVTVAREQETGHGPVDFTFSNNLVRSCILEIKLATNHALNNGKFLAQIYKYAKGLNVFSAFLLVAGFEPDASSVMNTVYTDIMEFRKIHDDFYIQGIYIDISKKQSASKVPLGDIK